MPQIHGTDRNALQMVAWEQFIPHDSPVRVIDAFVDILDLKKLGFIIKGKINNGTPAYRADHLLKLYLYGYLNRTRSSRQLEKAAQINVEIFWLINSVSPCYKTIANFRKDNRKALKKTFQKLNKFLKGEGLFDSDTVAIDGTKIAAQNSMKNNYNEKKIKRHLDYIDRKTTEHTDYLQELDEADATEDGGFERITDTAAKLDHLHGRKEKYEGLKKDLAAARSNHQAQISTTDPDARALPKKMNIVEVAYNVQTAVESENKLITNFEVTNENDTYALADMAIKAKKVLEKKKIDALADKGYDTGSELKKCTQNGITTYVAPRKRSNAQKDSRFRKEKFYYNHESHTYTCPQGKQLSTNGTWYTKKGGKAAQHRKAYKFQRFEASVHECRNCPFKVECASQSNLDRSKGRHLERSESEDWSEENRERTLLNKELYRTRQAIVEHPFGTIKRGWGYHYTLLRTKKKVAAEMALIFACYNLRRAMSIFGAKDLLKRLRRAKSNFFAQNRPSERLSKPFFRKWEIAHFYCFCKIYGQRWHIVDRGVLYLWVGRGNFTD